MRVTILGSGSSSGVPTVGRGWGNCDPENPKNVRLRASILVENGNTTVLVDTSPDLRQQLLAADVERLDGVIFTHFHADHLHGIDDLRAVNWAMNAPIDAYADGATLDVLDVRFKYVLEPLPADAKMYFKPTLNAQRIEDGSRFRIGSIDIETFEQDHGFSTSLGFRFGPIAYTTDLVELPERAYDVLEGVEAWIIGTPLEVAHPTHVHVGKALEWIDRVRPKRAVLSHLSVWIDYAELAAKLPPGVEPAFDGMVIEAG